MSLPTLYSHRGPNNFKVPQSNPCYFVQVSQYGGSKIFGLFQQLPVGDVGHRLLGPFIERFSVLIAGGLVQADVHEECWAACEALSRRLESELRAAKSAQLSCGEVLLPDDLLPRVAADVLRLAENEPCGLRGCTLFINFETDTECRRIGTVKCDPNTVSTFELFLTLKRDSRSTWHSILPQFIKNLTKGGTIMISPGFTLEKKKLYRSYLD
ncbi:hypothetical protein AAG570_006047 [Ranatra chinensis]|uniref:Protein charybde n=1 Tax=Ranatra chinensis TaxID=642074 RepID=A0ABD0XWV9_9HEMI